MFDIAVVDPPSFSSSRDSNNKTYSNNSKNADCWSENLNSTSKDRDLKHHFDIAQDHPLLIKAVVELMRKDSGSVIFFSTNHQNFELNMGKLMEISEKSAPSIKEIKEITAMTIPEDYKTPKKQIHRCWKIVV